MNLLDKQYDRRSEEKAEENLDKAENQIAALSKYTEFFMQKKHEKAKEHLEEVEKLEEDITKVWELFNKNAHKRSAAPPASPAAARRPPPAGDGQIKLVTELKPETLAHDASAGKLRIWLKKFEAYYIALGMQNTRIAVQHAYLLNCLDSELSLQLDGCVTAQTPVLGPNSCLSKLTEIFKKKYPLLLRRKNFFQMSQQQGQDERAFLEQIKSAAAEADIEGMNLEDALCLTLLSGLRDARLREKLSELEQPTLPAFGVLIDAYLHSKATSGSTAAANRSKGRNQQQNKNKGGGAQKVSKGEKKRRNSMKGKCFRCGSGEHMANNCRVAKNVKCRSCGTQGHIQSACGPGKARATEEAPAGSDTLAIEYQQQVHQYQQQENAQANVAHARQGHNSLPTPPLLL